MVAPSKRREMQCKAASKDAADAHVIAQIRNGEVDQYAVLMRRYNQRLYRIARSIVLDDQRAMDVVQDAHLKIFQNLYRFADGSKFVAWASVITRNEALMMLRKTKSDCFISTDPADLSNLEDVSMNANKISPSNPDDIVGNRQVRNVLNAHIDKLPEKFRAAFVMRCVEQLSVKDTAEILGVNQATVKTRVFRAKNSLQHSLSKQYGDAIYEIGGGHCDQIVAVVMARITLLSDSSKS